MTETRADSAVTCVTSVFSALPGETAALPPTSASRRRFNIDTVDMVVCQLGLLLGNTFFFFYLRVSHLSPCQVQSAGDAQQLQQGDDGADEVEGWY